VIADIEYLDREFVRRIASGIDGVSSVKEYDCGEGAVAACLLLKPGIVVLGCKLGDFDGFETARRIRRCDKDIAILMTGWDECYFREYEAGQMFPINISAYLLKPIHPAEMKETLLRHITKDAVDGNHQAAPKTGERISGGFTHRGVSKEIAAVMSHIDDNFRQNISLESVAACISISTSHLSRLFKQETGVNFLQYLTKRRLEYAKQIITQTDRSMLEIAIDVGFSEQNYFGKVFKRYTGKTPLEYKRDVCWKRRQPESKDS
jgi:YesN/AraC family two-component response regulator